MINVHFETRAVIEGTSDGTLTQEQTIALLDVLVGSLSPFDVEAWMKASEHRRMLREAAERARGDGTLPSPKTGD